MNGPQTPATKNYNPCEHLVVLKTANGPKEHYPFHWRLHEFRLRYPNGVLDAQIVQLDVERDFVVVKVVAKEDDLGNCQGVGLSSGSLTLVDKVAERAKAQALVDLGIGCAWPIAFDDMLETLEIVPPEQSPTEALIHSSEVAPRASNHEYKPVRSAGAVQAQAAPVVHLDQHKPTAQTEQPKSELVSQQQVSAIRRMSQILGKKEPANLTSMSSAEAGNLIQQLNAECSKRPKAS